MPKRSKSKSPRLTVDAAKALLAPFLKNNPSASVGESIREGMVAVRTPWGDTSLELRLVPHALHDLVDALNNVLLPERFTAIWHLDTKRLEVIYTAFPTHEANRAFTFRHRGGEYKCRFDDSSGRLLLFAEWYYPVGPSETGYRNLTSFSDYVLSGKGVEGVEQIPDGRPISFWIDGLEWDESNFIDLILHLNFYMAYYDPDSAQILLHSPQAEAHAMQPEPKESAPFPNVIQANAIEENLLHFWRTAKDDSDPIRAFLNNYLILEAAAFFYIDDTTKKNVRKVLITPNAASDLDFWTRQILEAIGEKMQDHLRIQRVLKDCVDPKLVWREFSKSPEAFCRDVAFDGGVVLEKMFNSIPSEAQIPNNWENLVESKLSQIRNALSHGKERRTLATISPTAHNFQLLEPWIPVIAVAAREVMLYRKII